MQQTFTPVQNNVQSQQRMSTPPQYITTKDLLYLGDALNWELIAMKKCNHFARECQDNEIRNSLLNAGRMHSKHYQLLLKHVNPAKSIT